MAKARRVRCPCCGYKQLQWSGAGDPPESLVCEPCQRWPEPKDASEDDDESPRLRGRRDRELPF